MVVKAIGLQPEERVSHRRSGGGIPARAFAGVVLETSANCDRRESLAGNPGAEAAGCPRSGDRVGSCLPLLLVRLGYSFSFWGRRYTIGRCPTGGTTIRPSLCSAWPVTSLRCSAQCLADLRAGDIPNKIAFSPTTGSN